MGRTNKVQSGQIAGATELRLAHKIPATKVPCAHAVLLARAHPPPLFPPIPPICSLPKPASFIATVPSPNQSLFSGLPLFIAINGVSLIKPKGPKMSRPLYGGALLIRVKKSFFYSLPPQLLFRPRQSARVKVNG